MKRFGMSGLLMAASVLFSLMALGDQVFGVLRVDSTARRTIVSVPWVSETGDEIAAVDLVKTANLSSGDQLYYYDGNKYQAWRLSDNVWTNMPVIQASSSNTSAAEQLLTVPVGKALILIRQNPYQVENNQTNAIPFYLCGMVPTGVSSQILETNAFNLVGCPLDRAYTVNEINWENQVHWTGNLATSDQIIIDQGNGKLVRCVYKETSWQYQDNVIVTNMAGIGNITGHVWVTAPTIPAGQGFWYVSCGNQAVTVSYPSVN